MPRQRNGGCLYETKSVYLSGCGKDKEHQSRCVGTLYLFISDGRSTEMIKSNKTLLLLTTNVIIRVLRVKVLVLSEMVTVTDMLCKDFIRLLILMHLCVRNTSGWSLF